MLVRKSSHPVFTFVLATFFIQHALANSNGEFQSVKLLILNPSSDTSSTQTVSSQGTVFPKQYDRDLSPPPPSKSIESGTTENYYDAVRLSVTSSPSPAGSSSRNGSGASSGTSSRVLDPLGLGVWTSARNMMKKGIHRFRESLHEGVKVAKMLKEDVDEGVSTLMGPTKVQVPNAPNRKSRKQGTAGDKDTHSAPSTNMPSLSSMWESLSQIQEIEQNLEESFGYQLPRQGVLGGILKFMGVDSSSIGIILLNILIFVAEMVTSTMLGKDANSITDTRALKANLYEWVVTGKNDQVSDLINEAQDPELPENIIDALRHRTGNKTSCVQLLLCKMSPFVRGIQETVDKEVQAYHGNSTTAEQARRATSGLESYFSAHYLEFIWSQLSNMIPDKKTFLSLGDSCEKRFPTCKLLKFSPSKADKNKKVSRMRV